MIPDDLASLWRALGSYGLLDTIFNHVSAREAGEVYIYAYGYLPADVTAEAFVPLSAAIARKDEPLFQKSNALLHSEFHAQQGARSILLHIHSKGVMQLGSLAAKIMPVNQICFEFLEGVAYIDYTGTFDDESVCKIVISSLGPHEVAILRGHGALIAASSIPEAFYLAYYLDKACELTCCALSSRADALQVHTDVAMRIGAAMREARGAYAAILWEAVCRM